MKLLVLGSAAGGGFPQWNCNCANCHGVRHGLIPAKARTQSSIAVTGNQHDWLLVNASPDVLTQVRRHPELQPARGLRDSGIAAALVIDAQIDHVTGLLMLRERHTPLPLYATAAVQEDLRSGFPLLNLLGHYCGVHAHTLALDGEVLRLPWLPACRIEVLAVASKAPPYSPHREAPERGDNIALSFVNESSGRTLFYAPGLEQFDDRVRAAMQAADILMLDGTFWSDDEMIRNGLSKKRARDMGHLALSGAGGLLEQLDGFRDKRRILIHINNTNPILREDSGEAQQLASLRIEVAHDGMAIEF